MQTDWAGVLAVSIPAFALAAYIFAARCALFGKPRTAERDTAAPRSQVEVDFKQVSTRKKQAYAVLCLAEFCKAKQIRHAVLMQLMEQLLALLISENLTDSFDQVTDLWDDPQSQRCEEIIRECTPVNLREAFRCFVDNVVEVGTTDMYGADTEQPLHYLSECVLFMERMGVKLPPSTTILSLQESSRFWGDAWGKPIALEEYRRVLNQYQEITTS